MLHPIASAPAAIAALICAGVVLSVAATAQEQDQNMTINLNPSVMTETPCGQLMAGFSSSENIVEATKRAAEGGYRFGYVMGYVHGSLDAGPKKGPLTNDELTTFFDTFKLICDNDPKRSIYDAAREAMTYQQR